MALSPLYDPLSSLKALCPSQPDMCCPRNDIVSPKRAISQNSYSYEKLSVFRETRFVKNLTIIIFMKISQ